MISRINKMIRKRMCFSSADVRFSLIKNPEVFVLFLNSTILMELRALRCLVRIRSVLVIFNQLKID